MVEEAREAIREAYKAQREGKTVSPVTVACLLLVVRQLMDELEAAHGERKGNIDSKYPRRDRW